MLVEVSMALRDKDALAWWREARFGMFIHWGLYAVPAGIYRGRRFPEIGEWIMSGMRIPLAEYRKFAAQLNPVRFDADAWARLARDAGMKYMVITSKHHDGFAMFNSASSDYNIVKATPFGRDPLRELAAACHRHVHPGKPSRIRHPPRDERVPRRGARGYAY